MKKPPSKKALGVSAIDLFCGVGGMTHGLYKEGINVVAGVDLDSTCKYAFEKNNAAKFIEADIRTIKPSELAALYPKGDLKLLAGCAPCQPFSGYRGKVPKSDKWDLLYSFADLAAALQPDLVTMENVPGLLRFKDPPIFDHFCAKLRENGFKVWSDTVFCPDYGIPQTRTRLVLLASKLGEIELVKPTRKKDEYKTVEETIAHLPAIADGETSKKDPLHRASKLSPTNMKRIKATPAAGGWRDWDSSLVLTCHSKDTGKSYCSVYGRMRWDAPAPTMTTLCTGIGNGRFGHPEQHRAISLREAALFQTFPVSYDFIDPEVKFSAKAISRQIGNAVPVTLGKVIARSIREHLKNLGR